MKQIFQVFATDIDAGKFGLIRYRISQVTNGAQDSFRYDVNTNELKAIGPLNPGERYQVVIEAADGGGLSSQAIVLVYAIDVDTRTSMPFGQNHITESAFRSTTGTNPC